MATLVKKSGQVTLSSIKITVSIFLCRRFGQDNWRYFYCPRDEHMPTYQTFLLLGTKSQLVDVPVI
jgi:hypothetical protein